MLVCRGPLKGSSTGLLQEIQLNLTGLRNPAASEKSTFVSAAMRFLDFCTSAIRRSEMEIEKIYNGSCYDKKGLQGH